MSDDDFDKDWVPTGRPQSTLARNFSAALNDLFMIDNSVDKLAVSVDKKKQAVSSQSQELQALEARLRQTEELLKQRASSSNSPISMNGSGRNSPRRRTPLSATFGVTAHNDGERDPTSPISPLARFPPTGSESLPSSAPLKESQNPRPASPNRNVGDEAPPTPGQQDGADFVMIDRTESNERTNGVGHVPNNTGQEPHQPRNRPPPPPAEH